MHTGEKVFAGATHEALWVVNVLLNWLPKSRIFQKVIKKEQDELQKKVEGKCCYTELIHKFSKLTLSPTLANIK